MTETTRRTARMSPTATYTAVRIGSVAATTNTIRCVARKNLRIEGVNGAAVDIRAGEVFYLARSESLGGDWFYIVDMREGVMNPCSCPARSMCKHIGWAAEREEMHASALPPADMDERDIAFYKSVIDEDTWAEWEQQGIAPKAKDESARSWWRRDTVAEPMHPQAVLQPATVRVDLATCGNLNGSRSFSFFR